MHPLRQTTLEEIGLVRAFSSIGNELAKIVSAHPVPGFIEGLAADFARFKIEVIPVGKESDPSSFFKPAPPQ
jgi:hypothetical protein